jgi:hypothetical protein
MTNVTVILDCQIVGELRVNREISDSYFTKAWAQSKVNEAILRLNPTVGDISVTIEGSEKGTDDNPYRIFKGYVTVDWIIHAFEVHVA